VETSDTAKATLIETPQNRRQLLGLAVGGGLALTGFSTPVQALALSSYPFTPVLPERISTLSGTLELKSSLAWHLARRVCPAPTASIVNKINKIGYTAWIDQQLHPGHFKDTTAKKLVSKHVSWATKTTKQVVKASHDQSWRGGKAMSISRTIRQIYTERYLLESMVDTMGDHLYISADGKAGSFVGWFDWAVLRKYALGKYSSMLYAAITHPAMLVYLDNYQNSTDNPNENLGRELLELHTVGVGNYTETDVRQSALLLTGHGLDWKTYKYKFSPWDHYVGPVKVMGFNHSNASRGAGPDALKRYLYYLAHHPATARHICRRLAVRYVSDNPSESLVNTLAQVYLSHDTSLAAVMRALLHSSEFTSSVGEKWRRPQETMATMVKVQKPGAIKPKGTQSGDLWAILSTVQWLLATGGHQPRMWPVVNGYPDQARDWMATQDMLAHFDAAFARVFWTDKEIPVKSWAKALGVTTSMTPEQAAARITTNLTGYTWSATDLAVVVARLRGSSTAAKLTKTQLKNRLPLAVHLVFCSPYFMLR
jgi:uncharacterized protein (DUF1800 family)